VFLECETGRSLEGPKLERTIMKNLAPLRAHIGHLRLSAMFGRDHNLVALKQLV